MSLAESARRLREALDREILSFRFETPIETVEEAASRGSLRYHVFSESLFLDNQEFDADGIPRKRYRLLGPRTNPLFVAWWGLHQLERAARCGAPEGRTVFERQLVWLREAAVHRDDGAVVWPCDFDWQEGKTRLRAGWISAMYQGVVISSLVRGFRLFGDATLLETARRGMIPFGLEVREGGVRTRERGGVLYEEYPAYPLPRILDGFLFSLLGLYDLSVETGDAEAGRLFTEGVDGLVRNLSWWDYRGKWSWYGAHGYLCPPHYHTLNRRLLEILYRLTAEPVLGRTAESWHPAALSKRDRVEIFMTFVATKNLARLRLPNERGA